MDKEVLTQTSDKPHTRPQWPHRLLPNYIHSHRKGPGISVMWELADRRGARGAAAPSHLPFLTTSSLPRGQQEGKASTQRNPKVQEATPVFPAALCIRPLEIKQGHSFWPQVSNDMGQTTQKIYLTRGDSTSSQPISMSWRGWKREKIGGSHAERPKRRSMSRLQALHREMGTRCLACFWHCEATS